MRDRLLIALFLRRFLEGDLVSPSADREQLLVVAGAGACTAGIVLSLLLSMKYLFNPFQTVGWTTVMALDDRCFWISGTMVIMALVASAEWHALSLDGRDGAILGPLPIPRRVVVRAQLSAVAVFGLAFSLALSVIPALLHPMLMIAKLPIALLPALGLVAAQIAIVTAAGLFGFFAVLGLRECLRAVLPGGAFQRISTAAQAVLLTLFTTLLLLLPLLTSNIAQRPLADGGRLAQMAPPLWFLGLHERIAGGVIDSAPRDRVPRAMAVRDVPFTALYRSRRPALERTARVALPALVIVVAVPLLLSAWNNRTLSAALPARRVRRRLASRGATAVVSRVLVRPPGARAGFFLALASLRSSLPHRSSLAAALAVGLAGAIVSVSAVHGFRAGPSTPLLAVQTMLLTAVLGGFRHAMRLPAEPRARWAFQLAWSGAQRDYVNGVKTAGLVGLAVPIVVVLLVLYGPLLGVPVALAHAMLGVLYAAVLLEASLFQCDTLPFVSPRTPIFNANAMIPALVFGFLILTIGVARVEAGALRSLSGTVTLAVALLAASTALRLAARWRPSTIVDWTEGTIGLDLQA